MKAAEMQAKIDRMQPVVAAALEWQDLVDNLDAPAERIRPALQRLDMALIVYRQQTATCAI